MPASHLDCAHRPRRVRGRWLRFPLAISLLTPAVVLGPTPTVVSAAEATVSTEQVDLTARTGGRTSEPLATAVATEDDGPTARAALDAISGRRTVRRATAGFQAIGVTVPVAPSGPLLVRGRVDGSWTPWTELQFTPGEAPDASIERTNAGVHSEPVWLGDADAYELDGPAALRAVAVHVVGDGPVNRSVALVAPAAGAASAPTILPAAAWSARAPKEHPLTTADLRLAIVHHSVSSNTYSAAQVPALLRSVQAYHQDVQGWNDIAYNFAVDRFGRIWEGRAGGVTRAVLGGHSQGFNTGTVGVVVLGDFRSTTVPSAAVEAVAQVIAWKLALHRVDPASTVPVKSNGSTRYAAGATVTLPRIIGHRDVQATDCPGAALYGRLGAIRARVAQLVPTYQQGLDPLVLDPDVNGDGLTDPLEYRPGATADTRWTATPSGTPSRSTASIRGAYRPAVGDFDGNGRSDVVWHGTGSTNDHVWWSEANGSTTSRSVSVGGSYVPIAGDFDGNGVDDIFWYSIGRGTDSVWYFQRDRSYVSASAHQDLITGEPMVGDVNADGRDDIFFYGPGPADDELWRSTGRGWTITRLPVNGWYAPVMLDATADGRADIVWYAPGATTAYRWEIGAGRAVTSRSWATAALTGVPTAGDFDGDGRDDVLISAPGAATDVVWYSTPTGVDARAATIDRRYITISGPMDELHRPSDDVFFLSPSTSDYLWQGLPTRAFRSNRVG